MAVAQTNPTAEPHHFMIIPHWRTVMEEEYHALFL
jgi:hypothetical protein